MMFQTRRPPGRHRAARRRSAVVAVAAAILLGFAAAATAMWTVHGADTASFRTGEFDLAGIRPTVRAAAQEVAVSWTQPVLGGGRLGAYGGGGYLVRRYDADGHAAKVGGTCAGRVAGTGATAGCREHEVPDGTWWYAVTPVLGTWTGTEGPRRAVTVQAAPPSITVGRPAAGETTHDRRPVLAGSAGTAPGHLPNVTVTLSRGRAPGRFVSTIDARVADGRWTARPSRDLADGVYTVRARQETRTGHWIRGRASSFRVDATAPTTDDDTASIGGAWQRAPQTVRLAAADRGGAGVAATYYTVDGSTPTIRSRSGTTVTVGADGVHLLRYFSVDRAGNAEAVRTAVARIRIDRTPPHVARLNSLPKVVRTGQVLTVVVDDALSGVLRVVYEGCADEPCHTWTPIGSSVVGPAYPVAWHRQPTGRTYRLRARVIDAAGNVAVSGPRTVGVDNGPPTPPTTDSGHGTVEAGDPTTSTRVLLQLPR
jgi:hypothetical protein